MIFWATKINSRPKGNPYTKLKNFLINDYASQSRKGLWSKAVDPNPCKIEVLQGIINFLELKHSENTEFLTSENYDTEKFQADLEDFFYTKRSFCIEKARVEGERQGEVLQTHEFNYLSYAQLYTSAEWRQLLEGFFSNRIKHFIQLRLGWSIYNDITHFIMNITENIRNHTAPHKIPKSADIHDTQHAKAFRASYRELRGAGMRFSMLPDTAQRQTIKNSNINAFK